jgi:hypothetical protein
VSDQDFFFDEDEKAAPKASKPAPKGSPAKTAKPAPKQPTASAAPSSGFELTWTITALIAVVTLLVGVIIGYAIPKGVQDVGTGTTSSTSAPQLTPEQMSTGELPAGHPDITGMSSGATSSTTTTGN